MLEFREIVELQKQQKTQPERWVTLPLANPTSSFKDS